MRSQKLTCGLSLLLVLVMLRGFFSGFSGFPPSAKTNISIGTKTDGEPLSGYVAIKSVIIDNLIQT